MLTANYSNWSHYGWPLLTISNTLLLGQARKINLSTHHKPSPLQSTAESSPYLAVQPSCSPEFLLERTYCCNGKQCSSTSLCGLYMTYLSLGSGEKPKQIKPKQEQQKTKHQTNWQKRTDNQYTYDCILHVTVRDALVAGFLLMPWCLKEGLYSWFVFNSMNKFMSQVAWLAD